MMQDHALLVSQSEELERERKKRKALEVMVEE
jgi:hypothetical protein